MARDAKGNYHLNDARMRAASKGSTGSAKPTQGMDMKGGASGDAGIGNSGGSTTLHDHGDGTFHTEGNDGAREEHSHIGHALMHMASKHGGEGMHMHLHSDGMSHTSHHAEKGGKPEGPHEHESMEAMQEHVGNTMGDGMEGEGGKDQFDGDGESEESQALHGM
jgi:hypothetical protein